MRKVVLGTVLIGHTGMRLCLPLIRPLEPKEQQEFQELLSGYCKARNSGFRIVTEGTNFYIIPEAKNNIRGSLHEAAQFLAGPHVTLQMKMAR